MILPTLPRLLTDAEDPARGRVPRTMGCNISLEDVEGDPSLPPPFPALLPPLLLLLPLPERFLEGGETLREICTIPEEAEAGAGPGGGRIPPTGVFGLERVPVDREGLRPLGTGILLPSDK